MKISNEELARKAKAGDKEAEAQLFINNERFIPYIANKYKNTGYDFDDLCGCAQIGMVKAYNSFDPDRGFKFATYASRCMENEVLMFLRREKKHLKVGSIEQSLNTDAEGNNLTLLDVLEDPNSPNMDESFDQEALHDLAERFALTLPEREMKIFFDRVIFGRTQHELADELGISQSYVARITQKVKSKLQKFASRTGFTEGGDDLMASRKVDLGAFVWIAKRYPDLKPGQYGKMFGVTSQAMYTYLESFKKGTYNLVKENEEGARQLLMDYFPNLLENQGQSGGGSIGIIKNNKPDLAKVAPKDLPKMEIERSKFVDPMKFLDKVPTIHVNTPGDVPEIPLPRIEFPVAEKKEVSQMKQEELNVKISLTGDKDSIARAVELATKLLNEKETYTLYLAIGQGN